VNSDTARFIRIVKIGIPIGLATHFIFLVVFWELDLMVLAYFNAASVFLWASGMWLVYVHQKFQVPFVVLALIEVPLHAILATVYLGGGTPSLLRPESVRRIVDAVRAIRRRHPEWPVVVAQTTIHEGYAAGDEHVKPYPFADQDPAVLAAAGVSTDIIRSLSHQRELFEGLPGKGAVLFVPIDFTLPEDGWEPSDYGYEAFLAALEHVAPAAVVTSLHNLLGDGGDALAARAQPHILGYATAAGAADIWPVG
jgi:hypothetical protein